MRHLSSLIAIIVICSVASSLKADRVRPTTVERELFDAANRERRSQGLPALHWDEALANAARNHAQEMAKRSALSHQFPGELNLPSRARQAAAHYTWLAENVDQGPNAAFIHRQLMNSPEHRANILDKDMDSMGVGVAGRGGQWFAVEDFSKAASH